MEAAEDAGGDAVAAAAEGEAADEATAVVAEGEEAGGEGEEKAPRVVVVFGATEAQGSAVVAALKEDSSFTVKAVTSDADSDEAKALAETKGGCIKCAF